MLQGDVGSASDIMVSTTASDMPLAFHVFRSILQPASFHQQTAAAAARKDSRLIVVEPLVLAALLSLTTSQNQLLPGQDLQAHEGLSSPGFKVALRMQHDGNLVLYTQSRVLWASGTAGHPGARLVLQGDGNLVVYDANGTALWSTSTAGQPVSRLQVQDDCNVVLYAGSAAIWSSGTSGKC